jgi:hypothetical protein
MHDGYAWVRSARETLRACEWFNGRWPIFSRGTAGIVAAVRREAPQRNTRPLNHDGIGAGARLPSQNDW